MLTIVPFKTTSRDKEDSYLQLLDKIRSSSPNQLIEALFNVEKEQIYYSIFKTNDLSKLTSKSYEKNVKQLAEFFTIFTNFFSQIEDLNSSNPVHDELFDKLINFIFVSFQTLFKQQMNEVLSILVNFHKFLHNHTHYQQKLVSFIIEKFFDINAEISETIVNCKESVLDLIISCIDGKYDQNYYINFYVSIYNFFLRKEELPSLNDKKLFRHVSNLLKKGSNLPNEFIRLTFYLNYINSVDLEGNTNIPDNELFNILPKSGFSFETSLINSLIKSSLTDLRTINREEGVKNYGRKSTVLLLSNIALRISYSQLQRISESELSFNDLMNKYSISIEDLEEVLVDGNESNLFEVIVDYKSSRIIIKYVKRNEFSKESIIDMKNKISGLKQKLTNLKDRLDSLTN